MASRAMEILKHYASSFDGECFSRVNYFWHRDDDRAMVTRRNTIRFGESFTSTWNKTYKYFGLLKNPRSEVSLFIRVHCCMIFIKLHDSYRYFMQLNKNFGGSKNTCSLYDGLVGPAIDECSHSFV